MPGYNGSGFTTSYNSSLGEAESAILDAGINLFELKPKTLQYYNDKIMGMWAVKVNHRPNANNTINVSLDWYNQKGAYVVVDVFGKDGKRFAYVPDDPVWHNRMLLIAITLGNDPLYEILRYHTQQGFAGGSRALKELVMLRDLTHEWVVWDRDKQCEVHRSFDGAECDDIIAKEKRKDLENDVRILDGAQVVVKSAAMYKRSEHLELRSVKIKKIEKIIARASYNWMMDEEWRKEILPDIQKQIANRFGEADMKERRAEALKYLPEIQSQLNAANAQIEQLKPLVELMKDPNFLEVIKKVVPGAAEVKIPEKVEIPKIEVNTINTENGTDGKVNPIEAPATHVDLGEKKLEQLSVTALRSFAKSIGVKGVEKKSQEALLSEIRDIQGVPDAEASDEADHIDVND